MCAIRLRGLATLVTLVVALPLGAGEPAKEPQDEKVRLDLYGDPLPKGAIIRLGSVRFHHPGAVWEVAFSPDGKTLAASSDGLNMVILWDRAAGCKIREIFLGTTPGQAPHRLRFSADGKRLYACSSYGRNMSLYAWDVASGRDAKDVPHLPSGMRTLGYSPDAHEMLLLHSDAEVVRWDIEKSKEVGHYRRPGSRYLTLAALVGERVLVPYFDGQEVGTWDVAQIKQLWSVKSPRGQHESDPPIPGCEGLRLRRPQPHARGPLGGPQARKILAGLAAGAAGEQLTLEARAALDRLTKAER